MSNPQVTASIPASALSLGLAGIVPFAAAALSMWVPVPLLSPEAGLRLGVVYGAVILSFLGGIRWGAALGPFDPSRQGFEFTAGVLGSLAGLAAAFLPAVPALSLLITGFLLQALWDVSSAEAGRLPGWFGRLRTILTGGVVISLVAMLMAVVAT